MFALSTAWNSKTHSDVKEMLSEIGGIGFNAIEISHHFSQEKLDEIIKWTKVFGINVVSVHNFCPIPPVSRSGRGLSDTYRFSSLDEDERRKAVEYAKGTVDTAVTLGAQAVVIHAGVVETREKPGYELMDLSKRGDVDPGQIQEARCRLLEERELKKAPYLEAVAKSLSEILPCAKKAGVKIGLETRYNPEEIPNFEEIEYFLKMFADQGLYYWHDVGHAEVNERLGIVSHLAYLQKYSERMIGMHLHDIKGLQDHIAPLSGEFDFSKIIPFLSDNVIRVIEVNSQASSAEIINALCNLEGMCIIYGKA